MSLPRLNHATQIADQLNELAAKVKTRSRASLTDANHILETIATRFFNALFGWDLTNLNTERANYPAADLGDRGRRIAIQVTNEDGSDKIKRTTAKAITHGLGTDFDRLIVFFLLPKKPGIPKQFTQPPAGPTIETWDIPDLLKQMQDMTDLEALAQAATVLNEEMGRITAPGVRRPIDVSRIIKYAPAELIGREDETGLLHDAWAKVQNHEATHPHVFTFVALGGEGKTSLVAKWLAELAHQDWPRCDAVFAWSFYSQGSREQTAVSSDLFLAEALRFFGDAQMADSAAGAFDKGRRLVQLVAERRALLILDGLEPLQYAPTSPTPGQLKDQGVEALLKGLAGNNRGLCVVTTRYSIPDLRTFWQTTAPEHELLRLSTAAGIDLLRRFGVRGTHAEFENLVEDVKGHALTLNLLGAFLKRAFKGDIRQRDRVKYEKADARIQGGHAFRTIAAYVNWMQDESDEARRELAILQLLGLFDRPAAADCIQALVAEPEIPGLTEPLVGLADDDWEFSLTGLEEAKLLTVNRDAAGTMLSLDAHPLLREYFAKCLCDASGWPGLERGTSETPGLPSQAQSSPGHPDATPDAWRTAHRRLYEHLCASTTEGDEPTLEDLQPLYQAVAHGCHAGLQQEACGMVYGVRILRLQEFYSSKRLGAFGANLGAVTYFFERPLSRVSTLFSESTQAWLLNEAAFYLRGLGRLTDAIEPMRATVEISTRMNKWKNAAICASSLSELELKLGEVVAAAGDAVQGVTYADRSNDAFTRIVTRTTHADALHHAGRPAEAEVRFREAERLQAEDQPAYWLLYSQRGFRYCDLLLTEAERDAWQVILASRARESARTSALAPSPLNLPMGSRARLADAQKSCRAVSDRAAQTLKFHESKQLQWILDIGLDHLTLGRAALYAAILNASDAEPVPGGRSELATDARPDDVRWEPARRESEAAVTGLRRSGRSDIIPARPPHSRMAAESHRPADRR